MRCGEYERYNAASKILVIYMAKAEPKSPGLLLIGVGTILASTVISGFILGFLTDMWLETSPAFMLLFGGLGVIGGFLKVYKMLMDPKLNKGL